MSIYLTSRFSSPHHHLYLAISLAILHPPLISPSMSTSGALTALNMAMNDFRVEGAVPLAAALKDNSVLAELNISDCNITYSNKGYHVMRGIMAGVIAIANIIPTMGGVDKPESQQQQHWSAGGQ